MEEPSAAARPEFENVVRSQLEYLYALAVRLTGNRTAAEDLVQDAWLPTPNACSIVLRGSKDSCPESYKRAATALFVPITAR